MDNFEYNGSSTANRVMKLVGLFSLLSSGMVFYYTLDVDPSAKLGGPALFLALGGLICCCNPCSSRRQVEIELGSSLTTPMLEAHVKTAETINSATQNPHGQQHLPQSTNESLGPDNI